LSRRRTYGPLFVLAALAGTILLSGAAGASGHAGRAGRHEWGVQSRPTSTPIKHVVVIFGENVSFDHYFGTYPNAANTDGQTFNAKPGTPAVDGLLPATSSSPPPRLRHRDNLITGNPNSADPQRLDSSATGATPGQGQLTCDQDHNYSDEQQAFDGGAMDHFVQSVGTGGGTSRSGVPCQAKQVMDYYDGNTVTGLWNYAQQ
jgi:phospholipase C